MPYNTRDPIGMACAMLAAATMLVVAASPSPARAPSAQPPLTLPDERAREDRQAQAPTVRPLSSAYFPGTWEYRGIEFGRRLLIRWILWEDGRLAYDFEVDDVPTMGSTGTWRYQDGIVEERWLRPNGSTGSGRGTVERIDDNTLRLTIIDNGAREYNGLSRIYRRLGPPQISQMGTHDVSARHRLQ